MLFFFSFFLRLILVTIKTHNTCLITSDILQCVRSRHLNYSKYSSVNSVASWILFSTSRPLPPPLSGRLSIFVFYACVEVPLIRRFIFICFKVLPLRGAYVCRRASGVSDNYKRFDCGNEDRWMKIGCKPMLKWLWALITGKRT